jgi:hypothetical protein
MSHKHMRTYTTNPDAGTVKIDGAAVLGLSGTADSLAYKVHEIEKHFHNSEQVFGNSSNTMAADTPVAFTVTGGDNAWGTELLLTDGSVIESGSSTKKFDLGRIYPTAVGTTDKISVVEFLYATLGSAVTSVAITDSTDLFTKSGHGLVDGDKIVLSSIVTTTGINAYTVYYVINMSGDTWQVSLTSGGSAVTVGGGDGTCSFRKLTQTSLTKTFIGKSATNTNLIPLQLQCPRVTCDKSLQVRAKSVTGSTVAISFLLGLHAYQS